MEPLRLVVNADDLGMSPVVNEAIYAALEAGWCRSASVLANGPAVEDALRRARAFPRHSFGVHLNLAEFRPLTGGLGAWLDAEGNLSPRSLHLGPREADAVLAEWEAQVARVRAAGIEPSHLDSHQHLHQRPALAPVLRELARRVGIRRVRGMGGLRIPARGLRARLGALRQRLEADAFIRRLRSAGLVTTDGFASVAVAMAHAGRLPAWRTVELMAHPGNPHAPRYAAELDALADGVAERLGRPVVPITWRDVG